MEATRLIDVGGRARRFGVALSLALAASACGSNPDNAPSGAQLGASGGGGAAGNGAAGAGMTAGASALGGSAGVGGNAPAMGGASGGVAQGGASASGAGGSGGTSAGTGGAGGTSSGGSAPSGVYPPAASGGDVAAGIAQLNLYRATLGLSQITLDAPSSDGCNAHLQYLIEEAQKLGQMGYLEHTENDHDNSHYSAASEQAGKSSDLAWGQSGMRGGGTTGQSLAEGVDLWINGVYHRTPLLNPGLVKVGAASLMGYNCVNYNAAGNTTVLKLDHPEQWPAPGMTDVPTAFGGNEGPCPTNAADPLAAGKCNGAGFIVSANFYNWGTGRNSALTSVTDATLTDTTTQMPVTLLTWYADGVAGHDPAPGYLRNEIALVPQASLTANTTYRVDINAVVNGAAMPLSWSFTTGTRTK